MIKKLDEPLGTSFIALRFAQKRFLDGLVSNQHRLACVNVPRDLSGVCMCTLNTEMQVNTGELKGCNSEANTFHICTDLMVCIDNLTSRLRALYHVIPRTCVVVF